jgi:hypothetical protein
MPALTRCQAPDRRDWWRIYDGGLHVGAIMLAWHCNRVRGLPR